MERSPWHARLSMLLIFSLIAQSVLTATCDLDRFRLGKFGVATVAVASPSDSDEAVVVQGVCTQCGGLTTPSGCCAHGIALSQGIPKPLAPHSLLLLAADEATGSGWMQTSACLPDTGLAMAGFSSS